MRRSGAPGPLVASLGARGRSLLRRGFVRRFGILTAANLGDAALALVQGLLIARWLGPGPFGVAALVMTYPNLVYAVLDARTSEAAVRYLADFDARGETGRALAMCRLCLVVDVAVAFAAFGLVGASAGWAARTLVHVPDAAGLVLLYGAASLPRAFVGTAVGVASTLGRFGAIGRIDLLCAVVRTGGVLGLATLGWGVAGVVVGNAVATGLRGLLYGVLGLALARVRWGRPWPAARVVSLAGQRRAILAFLAYSDVNALLAMVPRQLVFLIIGYYRPAAEAGYYKIGTAVAGAAGYLVSPLQRVAYADLAATVAARGRAAVADRVRRLTGTAGVPVAALVWSLALMVPYGVPRVFGPGYVAAVTTTQLLVALGGWQALWFWLRPAYMVADALGVYVRIAAAVTGLLVPAWLVVIPAFGAAGAAAVLLVSSILHIGAAVGWLARRGLRH